MAARRRGQKRSEEYVTRETKWNEEKRKSLSGYHERFRRPVVRFDAYGKPLAEGELTSEDVAWTDVVTGLERAVKATGDSVFSDALTCLKNYGLHEGRPKGSFQRAHARVFGDPDLGYLRNMKWLIDHQPNKFSSERSAAEEVAASYFYNAESFDAAAQSLRKKYAAWKRCGYQPQAVEDLGDAGYSIRAKPFGQSRVPLPCTSPLKFLDEEGLIVPFTAYWRQRFIDGDVWISRHR